MYEQEKIWNDDEKDIQKIKKASTKRPPRVLFFGMEGTFSFPSLAALLASGVEVCAVIAPASSGANHLPPIQKREAPRVLRSMLPLVNSSLHTSVVQLAWQKHIPVWEVSRLTHAETVNVLAAYQSDMICVACFSLLIPQNILALPRLSCLNVHPSLLPANRGPVPLFWTFREGSTTTGVTIHLMEEKMDSGAILAQESIAIPDGIHYSQLEEECARRGGKLLAQTVWGLLKEDVIPLPQDEKRSYSHSFPTDDDFVVQVEEWDALHVYNFIRGVGDWDRPVELKVGEDVFRCRSAISYSLENPKPDDGRPYYWSDEGLVIRCKTGWVRIERIE